MKLLKEQLGTRFASQYFAEMLAWQCVYKIQKNILNALRFLFTNFENEGCASEGK